METDYPYARCADAWQTRSLLTSLTWGLFFSPTNKYQMDLTFVTTSIIRIAEN